MTNDDFALSDTRTLRAARTAGAADWAANVHNSAESEPFTTGPKDQQEAYMLGWLHARWLERTT